MKTDDHKPKKLQANDATLPYRPGISPEKDARLTSFFIENHLDFFSYPDHVASPEQIRFMVYAQENERYYPCSDPMFDAIINKNQPDFLKKKYNVVLERMLALIDAKIEDPWEKDYLKSLTNIKFQHETRDEIMIPSRLEKRLMQIFLNRTHIEDPFRFEKGLRNRRVSLALNSKAFKQAINHADSAELSCPPVTLTQIKALVEYLELKRLFSLSVENTLWETDESQHYTKADFLRLFNRELTGNGIDTLFRFLGITDTDRSTEAEAKKKILWLADEAGEIMLDLSIIRYLAKRGHKILIAFKEGPLFTKVDFNDAREDTPLGRELEGAFFITQQNLGKNDLLNILRSDNNIIALSDGSRESLNLLLTSTTFARAFKEVDGVISRGPDQRRRLFDTSFQFTQDIFNISGDDQGSVSICYKPRHRSVIKFSHKDLEKRARAIIDQMEEAKKKGMTVIFYSGIIGSIPGKVDMAKKIMSVLVAHLKKQAAMTFIINPSEYFEPGMDADDLMYMWEIVQRSGFIDIWRFQTYGDISQAFQIMGNKVPPEWVGKDATFSTGCTKEMNIALDVQRKHPELQIIGPSGEKFLRRKEYGIGKMYDERLNKV